MLIWIAQNTIVAFGLASLAFAATLLLPKRPAIGHVLWVCVLVALVAPPLPRHGLFDGRAHAVRAASRAATSLQLIVPPQQSAPQPVAGGEGREALQSVIPRAGGATAGRADVSAFPKDRPLLAAKPITVAPEKAAPIEPEEDLAPPPAQAAGAGGRALPSPRIGGSTSPLPPAEARRSLFGFLGWRSLIGGAVVLVWVVGTVVVFLRTMRGIASIWALLRRGAPVSPAFRAFVERVGMDLGVRSPRVRVSGEVSTPFVWGTLRPTLVWPSGQAESSPGVRAVVAHELAHLERRDHWVAWLEALVTCVLWWHPLVYIARRQLRSQAEEACDAWVVWAYPQDRRHYADALLDAVERIGFSSRPVTALGAVDTDRHSLTRRLLMIMNDNVSRRGSRALVLAAAGLTVAFAPTWAAASKPAVAAIANMGAESDIDRSLEELVRLAQLEREAEVFADDGDYKRALGAMNQLLDADPDDADLHKDMGMMLYEAGEYQAAAKHFARAGTLGNGDPDQSYNAACCLALAGQGDAAVRELARAMASGYADGEHVLEDDDLRSLRKLPEFKEIAARIGDLEDLWEAGEEAMDEEAWADASRAFGSALSIAPDSAELQHLLGFVSLRAGDVGASREAFEAALDLGFDPGICLYNLACVETADGRYDKAFALLDRSISAGFGNYGLLREDADLEPLHGDPRFDEAVHAMIAPEKLRRELSMAMEFGEYDAAVEKARAIVAHSGDDEGTRAWASNELATALFMNGDYREAEREFADAAMSGGSLDDALYNIACCKAKRGRVENSLEYLQAAIDAGYDDAEHMQNDDDLAAVRDEPRFAELAGHAADRAVLDGFGATDWEYLYERSSAQIASDPENGRAHLQLGWALLRTDRIDEARSAFERQAELDFIPGIANYNVACCDAILGHESEAIDAIERAIDYGFDDVEFMREDPDLVNLRGNERFEALLEAHEDEHDGGDKDQDNDEDDDEDWDEDEDV